MMPPVPTIGPPDSDGQLGDDRLRHGPDRRGRHPRLVPHAADRRLARLDVDLSVGPMESMAVKPLAPAFSASSVAG